MWAALFMLTPPKSGQPRDQSEVGTEDPVILSTNGIHWTAEREDEGQTVQDRRRELLIQQGLAVNNGHHCQSISVQYEPMMAEGLEMYPVSARHYSAGEAQGSVVI